MFDKKYDAEDLASVYKSVYEKKLDPVGQEDKDIDNDGDHDKSDKYLLNRRKVRGAAIKTRKEEVELDENRRAARSAGGYKDDSKKQTDPSKDGFTGISGSIKDIMRQNKEIEAANKKKTKKEEVETVDEGMKKARENVGASTCWDGYKAKGTKKKNGREVPNCVKEEEELEEGKKELSREKRNKMFRRAGNLSREALQGGDKGSEAHKKSGKIVKALNKDAEENNRNDVREETLRDIYEGKKKGLWDNIHAKRKRGEKPAKPGDKDYPKTLNIESNEKLEEAAPALVGVLAKMAAKKAAAHVAKKGAEKVKDKMGKLLKGDEEEEG
tara:strand:- start:4626 stop:5606 length:981 start_codon:yes stop_codon:yes gene_type:complete